MHLPKPPRRRPSNARNREPGLRHSARLVQDHTLQFKARLERASALDQDSVLRANPSADHDYRGCTRTKGAWARDDDDRNAELQAYRNLAVVMEHVGELLVCEYVGQENPAAKRDPREW